MARELRRRNASEPDVAALFAFLQPGGVEAGAVRRHAQLRFTLFGVTLGHPEPSGHRLTSFGSIVTLRIAVHHPLIQGECLALVPAEGVIEIQRCGQFILFPVIITMGFRWVRGGAVGQIEDVAVLLVLGIDEDWAYRSPDP